MSGDDSEAATDPLVLEFHFDEPPEKLWRALSMPGLREHWLPEAELADPKPSIVTPGEALRYRMRDSEPPFLESVVTFRINASEAGGSSLHVIHELTDRRVGQDLIPANSNAPPLMRAAA
ncbi:uncharacterized protein YndB with AHSA1/START domain [Bosea sp. AK1]|uniref:SRPBCC family protein n=1 Tax=Bosea sp. AK1 TaxID=2587160 RepID=UPI001151FBF5|nr:hypothetical protein [Bosea sp. AK1]TQI77210.1 uncharacterized protein YndB with AHSA1/START domain [Bosea sp. AK1]